MALRRKSITVDESVVIGEMEDAWPGIS